MSIVRAIYHKQKSLLSNMPGLKPILLLLVFCFIDAPALAQPRDTGIVLMHGKQGNPKNIATLAGELRNKGYLVSTPLMPWAGTRMYDANVDEAMREIDREVEMLRKAGASRVYVGGQSMGANAAIAYAALRSTINGIIVLAPGHNPQTAASRKQFGDDVNRAREMVAAGKGAERGSFADSNQGKSFTVSAPAAVYLSWFDPEGAAVMPRNAAAIKSPLPMLFMVEQPTLTPDPKTNIFDRAPPHAKSRYVNIQASHFDVPAGAARDVVNWLDSLE